MNQGWCYMGAVLTLGCDMIPKINFAMQQNYIPFIRNLTVGNEGDEDISDVRLTIAFDLAFAKTFTYDISCVPSGKSVEISPLRIILSTEMLFSLTEAVSGTVSFSLSKDEKELYQKDVPVQLLAFNEWSGLAFDPELIAAFVTPNHPEIAKVISEASVYLKKWADTTAFSAYQRQNPNFVKQQMAALYAALCARRIAYNMPPASFEYIGQKIRLANTVLEQKQGTCLDLAVLYASCLEAVGLNPIIIFIEGHAFCGCHLEEETFADCATDDVSAIEKRIAAGAEELLLVECTDMTKENVDFDKSLKHGRDHMNTPGGFICAVDIARTRGSGIRPIPLRLEQALTHLSVETEEYIEEKRKIYPHVELISVGSSIKICKVCEGLADEYPRFAPTMEWDTAAGHAIAKASGAEIYQAGKEEPLRYNKPDLLNPWFIVKRN